MVLDYVSPASSQRPDRANAHPKGPVKPSQAPQSAVAAPAGSSAGPAASLEDLPIDALEHILSGLSLRDRVRASCVSRGWRSLLRESGAIWACLDCAALPDGASIARLCAIAGPRLRRLALRTVDPVLGLDAGAPVSALREAARGAPNLAHLVAPPPDTTATGGGPPGSSGTAAAAAAAENTLWSPADVSDVGIAGAVNDALAGCLSDPRVRAASLDLQRALIGQQACSTLVGILAPPEADSPAANPASPAAAASKQAQPPQPPPPGHGGRFLRSLCLDYNSLQDTGCAVLSTALPTLPLLAALSLGFNDIGDAGARYLAVALQHARVERVDLRHNRVGAEGGRAIAGALAAPGTYLRSLSFLHNRLGSGGVSALARVIRDPHCPLRCLDLSHNDMLPSGAKALVTALRTNAALESLGIAFNGFGVEETKELAKALARGGVPRLRSLDISRNCLGSEGVRELCVALKEHKCIEEVRAQVVAAGPEGARRLSGLLRASPTLRVLDVAGNNVGDRGAREIAAGAVENATGALTALHLEMNSIADDGAHALSQVVRRHRSLRVLGLSGNGIGCDGAGGLAAALRAGTALRLLDVSRNWLVASDRGSQSLNAAAAAGVPYPPGASPSSFSSEGASPRAGTPRRLHKVELIGVPT